MRFHGWHILAGCFIWPIDFLADRTSEAAYLGRQAQTSQAAVEVQSWRMVPGRAPAFTDSFLMRRLHLGTEGMACPF